MLYDMVSRSNIKFKMCLCCSATPVQSLADELLVLLVFWASLVLAFRRKVGITLAERSPRHCGHAINKLGLEQDVGVGEHAIL